MRICYHACLLMLCLSLFCACTTQSSPGKTTSSSGTCAPTGNTQSAISPSLVPTAQGDWPMFRGDITRSGSAGSSGGSKLTLAWSYCTGAPISASPVVHNGMVYIGSLANILTALDIRTGKKVWQIQANDAFFSTPAIENGIVYAAALNELYAINAQSGRVYWHDPVETAGGKFWSSPVVQQGLVIIGLASDLSERPKIAGRILAVDAKTGKVRWRTYTLANGAPGGGVWSSPAIDEARGVIYVATGDPDDGVQALSLHDGHVLWHWRSVSKDVSDTDIGAGPLLYRDKTSKLRVVVGGKDGTIYSLDAASGQVAWHTHIGEHIFSSPAFSHGTLYVVGTFQNRRALSMALDAQTGHILWKYAIPTMVYASPVIDGQTLYQPTGNGFGLGDAGIEVINATNGQRLQYMNLHSPSNSSPAILPSWLFVGASNGNLYAFTRSAQN